MRCFVYGRFEGNFLLRISAESDIRRTRSGVFYDEARLQFSDVRLVGRNACLQTLNSSCILCNIAFVGLNLCFYIFQLFEVDRIAVCRSGCHVGDCLVARVNACRGDRRTACNGKTCFAKRDVITRFEHFTAYALQSCERFAQFEFIAYFLLIRCACYRFFVVSNSQVLVHGSKARAFDGVGRSFSVFRFFRNGHIVARFDSGLAIFELRDVHRIGGRRTCGEVGDLSCFLIRTNRDSAVSGFPCRCGRSGCFSRSRVITDNTRGGTCFGTGTQSHAAFDADVGVIAENGDVRFFGFRFRFLRADNDVSVDVFQLVVVAHDEVMARVDDRVSIARHDVIGQFGCTWSFILIISIGKVVAYAGNLRIERT